jgi:hypothetical protein
MSNKLVKTTAFIIITTAVVLSIASSWDESLIVDEIPHIGAGYSYLTKGDMRLNPEHPPLAKDLAAIPLLFLNLKQGAFNTKFWQTDVNGQWEFGRNLIFNSGNDADQIRHFARLPILLFFVLSAVLIFKWARRLYGNAGAIIALILFSFSSTVIAHSRFVTTDMAALFGVFFSTYFFLKYLRNQTWKNLIIASVFFGIAMCLKFSTLLLIPFFLLTALIWGLLKKQLKIPAATILIFLIGFAVIVWPLYFLNTLNYPAERQKRDTQEILSRVYGESYEKFSPTLNLVVWASDKPALKPLAQYALGSLRVLHQTASEPHNVYFLGDVLLYGSHFYFPVVYFLKEPLAWWGLVVISLLFLAWQFRNPVAGWVNRGWDFARNHFEEFAMILWLIVYWATSINSSLNIGVRHLLPIYPFAILLVSGQIARIIQNAKIKMQNDNAKFKKFNPRFSFSILIFTFCILLGWYVVENLKTFPLYLTYFNQAAGGPSGGYRYVTDSNLDWGQDLIRFSDWVKKNNIPKIELDYFGWADQSYYLGSRFEWLWSKKYLNAEDFKAKNKSDGWLAVSVTYLQESEGPKEYPNHPNYLWLKSYQPVTIIGHSIFIYRIR